VLELQNISYSISKGKDEVNLLKAISLRAPRGHFMAIVGPSGCGKSTLLKTIAGINVESEGVLLWDGRNLSEEGDLEPNEFGYVPQFSIAYEQLTVEESVDNAIRLRVRTKNRKEMEELADHIIDQVGLDGIRENRVAVLSGGQKRRLGLALEMVTNPDLLLCDEVTSGLDPKSENEIVKLLHHLAKTENRLVISVTHSLGNLNLYDSVLVLHEGKVVYHGPPRAINHYFGVDEAEDVYPRLAKRDSEAWRVSWDKHSEDYYQSMPAASVPRTDEEGQNLSKRKSPGFFGQVSVLLERRWKIFFRDRTQLLLQFAMVVGFPIIVVLFALNGIEDLLRPADSWADNQVMEMKEQLNLLVNKLDVGSVISGLVMFQVVLLALMGSNNSAREIAAERQIFEKEKLGGLGTMSYLTSKVMFLSVLVLVQSLWMYLFVFTVGQQLGANLQTDLIYHPLLLVMVNAAMTSVCLGISASMQSPDQSSLLSIYLVGFQLPLSGAILALPSVVEPFIQPFISAYWSWSGIMKTLDYRYYTAVDQVTDAQLQGIVLCLFVLFAHIVVGLFIALIGAARGRWTG